MKKNYNGWANRETWNVALWLGNDYGLYQSVRSWGRSYRGKRIPARDAEEYVRQFWPNGLTPDSCDLDKVRWGAIAADIKEMSKD